MDIFTIKFENLILDLFYFQDSSLHSVQNFRHVFEKTCKHEYTHTHTHLEQQVW